MPRKVLVLLILFGLLSSESSVQAQEQIWRPFLELNGRANRIRAIGQGNLFLPLRQDSESLLFADMRGVWTDLKTAEGNWGLGFRRIFPSEWILGGYAFYDLRRSQHGNKFQQATLGAELLNVNWGFRLNGYIPDREVELVPGLNTAFIQGNNIVVGRGEERAYYGIDYEVERLFWHMRSADETPNNGGGLSAMLSRLDAEVWAAAGVFHFDNETAGFENITGPKFRTELRLYDLPNLGVDSRLVVSGQYAHDGVRGNVFSGMMTVRIPFGPGGRGSDWQLNPLERRMVTPIVRDIDVVTNIATVLEPAKVARTNAAINSVVVVDASGDIANEVTAAGANSVVILDGGAGAFNTTGTVVLQNGQVLLGGGSQLELIGCNTHTPVVFTGPGVQPTINHSFNSAAITLARNNQVAGLNLQGAGAGGGNIGISGTGSLSNVAVTNNIVEDFGGTGISIVNLNENGNVFIASNTIRRSGADGLRFGTAGNAVIAATIDSNVVENSALDGIQVTAFNSSRNHLVLTNNVVTASGADSARFDLQNDSVTTLIFQGNTLTGAASDSIEFDLENNSRIIATISNNTLGDTTFGEGFEIDQDQNSWAQMQITGNTILNSFADPLDIDLDNNAIGLYQVANNQFTSPQPASIIDIDTNDSASLGLQMFGNTSNVNLSFDEDGSSTFRLEDTLGTNTLTGGATLFIDPAIEIVPVGTFFAPPQ